MTNEIRTKCIAETVPMHMFRGGQLWLRIINYVYKGLHNV